jgi:hypothetical protein
VQFSLISNRTPIVDESTTTVCATTPYAHINTICVIVWEKAHHLLVKKPV